MPLTPFSNSSSSMNVCWSPTANMASSPLALFAAFLLLLFPRSPLGIKCLNCRTTDEDALVCDLPCEGDICALWRYREMSTNLRIQGCLSGADLRSPTSRLKMGCRRNVAGAQLCLCRDIPLCNADIGHEHSSTETADNDAVQQVMPADIRCQSHTWASFITRQFVRPPRYGCQSDLCFFTETNISRPSADDPLGNPPRIDSSISQSCGAQREFNFDLLLGPLWPGNGLHSDACYQLEDGRSSILGCSCSNNDCNHRKLPYPIDSTQKRVKCHLERPLFSSLSSNSSHVNFCHGQFCFVQRMPFPQYDGQWAVNSGCLSANESAARTSLKSGYRNILGVEQWLCEENFCNLIIARNGEEQTTGERSGGAAQKMKMTKTTERPTVFAPFPRKDLDKKRIEHGGHVQANNHAEGKAVWGGHGGHVQANNHAEGRAVWGRRGDGGGRAFLTIFVDLLIFLFVH